MPFIQTVSGVTFGFHFDDDDTATPVQAEKYIGIDISNVDAERERLAIILKENDEEYKFLYKLVDDKVSDTALQLDTRLTDKSSIKELEELFARELQWSDGTPWVIHLYRSREDLETFMTPDPMAFVVTIGDTQEVFVQGGEDSSDDSKESMKIDTYITI